MSADEHELKARAAQDRLIEQVLTQVRAASVPINTDILTAVIRMAFSGGRVFEVTERVNQLLKREQS